MLRLTHASGEQRPCAALELDDAGVRVVRAEAPDFSASGDGQVEICISFEEGEGDTFSTAPVALRVHAADARRGAAELRARGRADAARPQRRVRPSSPRPTPSPTL